MQDYYLNHLQLNKLLTSVGSDTVFIAEVINDYIAQTSEKIRQLEQLNSSNNYQEIYRISHTLSSTSKMLGADKMSELFSEILICCKEGRNVDIPEKIHRADLTFAKTSQSLNDFMENFGAARN